MSIRRPLVSTNGRRVQMPAGDTLDPEVLAVGLSNMPTIRPSLNLDFLNRDSLDARLAFSRNSIGTRVNANGLVETVAANTPRFDHDPVTRRRKGLLIEESRTNLLTYSEQFDNGAWRKTRVAVVPDSTIAPDGTITADKLIEGATTGAKYAYAPATVTAGAAYTLSIFAKKGERNYAELTTFNTPQAQVRFDLTTGAITLPSADVTQAYAEDYGKGWWRLIVSFIATTTGAMNFGITVVDTATGSNGYQGNGSSGFYIWGAQVEEGAFPTSYIPTKANFVSRSTTATYVDSTGVVKTAAVNVARTGYRYYQGAYLSTGLTLEDAATNLVTYSEQFDNAAWAKVGGTVSADAVVAPDGTATADKFVESTDAGLHLVQFGFGARTQGDVVSGSIFVKPAERKLIRVRLGRSSTTESVTLDLSSQKVLTRGTNVSAINIWPVTYGWFRIEITVSIGETHNYQYLVAHTLSDEGADNYTGDGVSGIYWWGAQVELSSISSSYIPTTGATVTRAADISSSATVNRAADVVSLSLGSWFDSREGTILVAASKPQGSFSSNQFFFAIGTSTTRVLADYTNSGRSVGYHGSSGKLIVDDGALSSWRYALAYDATGVTAMTLDGASPLAGAYTPAASTTLFVGQSYTSAPGPFGMHNGHIRQLCYYPKRLTNAELQGITA